MEFYFTRNLAHKDDLNSNLYIIILSSTEKIQKQQQQLLYYILEFMR